MDMSAEVALTHNNTYNTIENTEENMVINREQCGEYHIFDSGITYYQANSAVSDSPIVFCLVNFKFYFEK